MDEKQGAGWGEPTEAPEMVEGQSEVETTEPEASADEGLILGKFKSQAELEAAYRAVEVEKARLANELGQARRATETQEQNPPFAQAQATSPDEVMEMILRTPPSQLAKQQGPWDDFVSNAIGWDTSAMEAADWVEAKNMVRDYKRGQAEQAQRQQAEQQKAVEQFFAQNDDLRDWSPLVAQVESDLVQQGRAWSTFDEYQADIAQESRARIGKLAAQWMGKQGGKASAQSRVVPGGGVTGVGTTTAPDENRFRVGWGNPE